MEYEAYVRSLGLDPTAVSPALNSVLEAQWRALHKPGDPKPGEKPAVTKPVAEIDEVTATTEQENARRTGIAGLFKQYVNGAPDRVHEFKAVVDNAIKGGMSVKDTEYQLLKLSYVNGPLAFSPSKPAVDQAVLEVAVARAANVKRETIEAAYDDKTLSAADRQFRGGMGLRRLLVMSARANGHRDADEGGFSGIASTKSILKAAFRDSADEPWQGAATSGFGPSTISLSGVLSNVMNKSIKDYFNTVETVWRMICAVRPVNDFKQVSGYALTGDLTYKKVAPGGEVKHGSLGETSYANRADLYAILLGIDYQHIRNDDMGAFDAVNKLIGRGGNLTINDVFWAEFMKLAGSFWALANGNRLAGTDYAFALDKLENVNVAWQLRTDPNGNPMGDKAKYLLTAPKWELKARRYMRSATVSNDQGAGEENPVAGLWEPVASTYLSNGKYEGNSADDYYLLADPLSMPVIEGAFLDGQEIPTIETAEPDLSHLGIMVRGMHAFGFRRQEPRGGYKFKQTAD